MSLAQGTVLGDIPHFGQTPGDSGRTTDTRGDTWLLYLFARSVEYSISVFTRLESLEIR
jgi:hypothetical protein